MLKFSLLNRASVQSGLGLGLTVVGLYTLVYLIYRPGVISPWLYWGSLLLYVVAMWRVNQRDFPSFRAGIANVFLVYFLGSVLYYLFYYVLWRYIDPGLIDLQFAKIQASHFAPEDLQPSDLAVTPANTFFGFCRGLMGGFVLAGLMVYWRMRD